MENRLERLIRGLELAGVKKYGRNKVVAEKVGYSDSSVAKILQGWSPLTDKFINAVCEAFGIDDFWVRSGNTPTLLGARGVFDETSPIPPPKPLFIDRNTVLKALGRLRLITSDQLQEVVEDVTLSEAVIEMLKMSQPDRLRALAMLIEMNEKEGGKGENPP